MAIMSPVPVHHILSSELVDKGDFMRIAILPRIVGWAILACLAALPASADKITIFAAASLRLPLDAILARSGIDANVSYAGSSTLARQIEFGAPADVFLSANPEWVDYLDEREHVLQSAVFAGNSLVLAGRTSTMPFGLTADELAQAQSVGRIAVPLVDSVPLGQYTKSALTSLGLFDLVLPMLAQVDNAGTARALLTQGAVAAAFLYQSDVQGTDLTIFAEIPAQTHPAIRYVAAAITPRGLGFLDTITMDAAAETFVEFGFMYVD